MSATTRSQVFTAVHTLGGLLPADMLVRISEGKNVAGSKPADYGLPSSRSVRDEAERSWEYLKPLWRDLRKRLPDDETTGDPASDPTGVAAGDWLAPLWRELGYGPLTPVGTEGVPADSDAEQTFPVSHRWRHVLVHQAAWNADLDKKPGGAGTVPPQSLLQECLNRTDAHLWGLLTNGRQVRLLRDSSALATASYVEFDLEAIFDGELFSEFVLLYRLLHVSRFEVAGDAAPSACWLEKWRTDAIESGTRALEQLRDSVKGAITALGTGFLRHPHNTVLRENVDPEALHAALLRLVYRLIFLFVAEDRGVLLDPECDAQARERYGKYFSSARLRRHATRRRGTAHSDLYRSLRLILDALRDVDGCPELGLPGLGGIFNVTAADRPLQGLELSNTSLLDAVRHLSRIRDAGSARWRPVDYRHIGSEELGSVYESLLELVPRYCDAERSFALEDRLLGNNRKKTGSYYTDASLIAALLDSTLDPLIDEAQKRGELLASALNEPDARARIVTELLSLTVCDPACGSGHFLVAAARRIAKRIAAVREENPEPTVDEVRHALREVVGRCLYGVDLNPMAVQLAKVSLWLEAQDPGKALSFLDAHIRLGNGLIGATPALLKRGIPDKAFKAVEGDDPDWAKKLAGRNELERKGATALFDPERETRVANSVFASGMRSITDAPSAKLRDVQKQEEAYEQWLAEHPYRRALHTADAWCAAFTSRKAEDAAPAITHSVFRALEDPEASAASRSTHDEISRLAGQYRFFHWHLEFPEVFTVPEGGEAISDIDPVTGWSGGFSCVVGNPPWDRVDFEDKKYFSVVQPSIAAIPGTARRAAILEWERNHPEQGRQYRSARRMVKSTFLFGSASEAFPLCAKGLSVKGVNSLQTDQLFTERFSQVTAPKGRFGAVIPTAIATGAGAQYLFSDFTHRSVLASLYDFENKKPFFDGVHSSYKFCLLSLTGRALNEPAARFAFLLHDAADLGNADHFIALSPDEVENLNPNTGTMPVFRSRRDAKLTAEIHSSIPVLWNEKKRNGNPWAITFKRLFDMTDDSDLFRKREDLHAEGWELMGNVFFKDGERMLPLHEGKMAHHFDHRWNSFYGPGNEDRRRLDTTEKNDPSGAAQPRYWITEMQEVSTRRNGREVRVPGINKRLEKAHWDRTWLVGWRDVSRTTDERTAIPAFLPRSAVGHTFPLMLPRVAPELVVAMIAAQSSLVFDFVSRQKISDAHMKLFIWKQLPVPSPDLLAPHTSFITPRVLELAYSAYDMEGLARDLLDSGGPFHWDELRRSQLRAELDSYYLHLYGISRNDADYILETFQTEPRGGLKHNEIARHGEFRTKRLVLAEYDRMATAGVSLENPLVDGENYTSTLNPPPGQGPRHPARLEDS